MANKKTANFVGVTDSYASTDGVWTLDEVRERRASDDQAEDWGGGPKEFDIDFLVIAGGGGGGNPSNSESRSGGGGAGGYINSYNNEASGGNTSAVSSVIYSTEQSSPNLTVTVGAGGSYATNGSNSVFSGLNRIGNTFNHNAVGGGQGCSSGNTSTVNGSSGGSGGGNGWFWDSSNLGQNANGGSSGNGGTTNQGTTGGPAGGSASIGNPTACSRANTPYFCRMVGNPTGGGGGGAGTAATDEDGGNGLTSTITGSSITNAGGGAGEDDSKAAGTNGTGQSGYGGGGAVTATGNNGVVVLRYPSLAAISFDSNSLVGTSYTVGNDSWTIFTAGSGTVSFV